MRGVHFFKGVLFSIIEVTASLYYTDFYSSANTMMPSSADNVIYSDFFGFTYIP